MKKFSSTLFVLALAFLPGRADAAPCGSITNCSFNFNETEVGAFGSGPFGTVTLILSGSSIDVTIDMAGDQATGFHIIDTGAHHAVTFNSTLSGPFAISNISDAAYSQAAGAGPFSNPPFGNFEIALISTCTNGGGCGVNLLSFTVTPTSGSFTDVNQLVKANSKGAYFASDIANASGKTGAVGVTFISDVPEPSGLLLLSIGLAGICSIALRPKKKQS